MKPVHKRAPRVAAPEPVVTPARSRKRTLIVVADGARARFYSPSADARSLRASQGADLVSPESRMRARNLKSDKPGRGFSAGGNARRAAFEPPHDYQKLEKHRFTQELARLLDARAERREYDQLVLVAPHRSLGELRKLLPKRVQQLVCREVAKDLTNITAASIWRQLAPLVRMSL